MPINGLYAVPETVAERALAYPEPVSWYAIRVIVRREKSVSEHLHKAGFETWLPTRKVTVFGKRHTPPRDLAVLPGYVLVRLPTNNAWHSCRYPGVVNILGSNLKPIPIPDAEIDQFRTVLDADVAAVPCNFTKGAKVEVIRGALAGQFGTVVRQKGITRVIFTLETLRRAVSVEIGAEDLQRIAA